MSSSSSPLGHVYLPMSGTQVGTFAFIVSPESGGAVEIGTPVTALTTEGVIVGVVTDMATIGTATNPVRDEMSVSLDQAHLAPTSEVLLATVQVYSSPKLRSVRAGIVRAANAEELLAATGIDRIEWPIPAGTVPLADGTRAKICVDGYSLLGPQSAHLILSGLSGQAAKTSYAGVLMRSALHSGDVDNRRVAVLAFNVKGDDLVWLDQPPSAGFELSELDFAKYEAMGIPPTPFEDVEVWAPSLPGGGGTRSSRDTAQLLRWDLVDVWDSLREIYPWLFDDDKATAFLSEFYEFHLRTQNPNNRIDTFDKLSAWFDARISEAEEVESTMAWRSHHIATVRRLRRMLETLPARFGGLLTRGQASPTEDIPISGWQHNQVLVVDIAGLSSDIQGLVIARTLGRLLRRAETDGIGVDHLIVFADELNAFAPSQGAEMRNVKKLLQKVSTQGRFAGISLFGACQKSSRIDELVRDNAATRAVGITSDAELASGVYGRLSSGLTERLATLPRGQMALWHHTFRGALVVEFPRPAWRTGKAKPGTHRKTALDSLGLSEKSVARATEGLTEDTVERIVAAADNPKRAVEDLTKARRIDMDKVMLKLPPGIDPSDPFAIEL